MRRLPGPRRASARPRITLLGLALAVLGLLLLAGCGASGLSSGITPLPTVNPGAGTGTAGPTTTPGQSSYAYLYSRIDYPLQIAVGASDQVTLLLSTQSAILTATPAPGSGVTTVGGPIPLPTNPQDYQDIGVSVETAAPPNPAIVWQLLSAPRHSLLVPVTSPGEHSHQYLTSVPFRWQVHAAGAGANSITIILHLYFVYLDGTEQQGTIQTTQAPIPIEAVAPTPLNTTPLPEFKLPIAGLTWVVGLLAALRFLLGIIKGVSDVVEPARDAAHVARAVHQRVAQHMSERQDAATTQPSNPGGMPYRDDSQWRV
jgi:hypothetical protein